MLKFSTMLHGPWVLMNLSHSIKYLKNHRILKKKLIENLQKIYIYIFTG
jgi:hypothetical protein